MKTPIVTLFLGLFSVMGSAFADESATTPTVLTLKHANEARRFYRVNGLLMNETCRSDLSRCKAYLTSKTPLIQSKDPHPRWLGNPAATNCKADGGTSLIFSDSGGNELGICSFDDGSMIDDWDLYRQQASRR
ncbi:MAG: DUF333 domain-containing protein [Oligoflexia bacterium]|nr:DUF333 domain-containing protein [Oligoflexia bacterium]